MPEKTVEFSKEGLKRSGFDDDVKAALQPICDAYGVEVELRGGIIDRPVAYTMKVHFTKADPAAERTAFERWCRSFGVMPEQYGHRFTNGGVEFELIGFEPGRPKFTLKGRRVQDGKVLLFTRASAKHLTPPPQAAAA